MLDRRDFLKGTCVVAAAAVAPTGLLTGCAAEAQLNGRVFLTAKVAAGMTIAEAFAAAMKREGRTTNVGGLVGWAIVNDDPAGYATTQIWDEGEFPPDTQLLMVTAEGAGTQDPLRATLTRNAVLAFYWLDISGGQLTVAIREGRVVTDGSYQESDAIFDYTGLEPGTYQAAEAAEYLPS